MNRQLTPRDQMPAVFGKDAEGNQVDMVASVAGHFAFVQFYRGHW